jgi:serine protease Do
MVSVASAAKAPPAHGFRLRTRAALAGLAFGSSVAFAALPVPAFAKGPESLADLADQVTDAVVNISASTTVESRPPTSRTLPQLPPGTPFEDLFEDFFNKRGQRGGGGGERSEGESPRQQRKSNSLGSGFGHRRDQQPRHRRRQRHPGHPA